MQYQKLNNGVMMPMLGYGTFQIPPLQTEKCILHALESGYRLIDSAAAYLNEKEIGKALQKSQILEKNSLSQPRYGFKILVMKRQ